MSAGYRHFSTIPATSESENTVRVSSRSLESIRKMSGLSANGSSLKLPKLSVATAARADHLGCACSAHSKRYCVRSEVGKEFMDFGCLEDCRRVHPF